MKTTLSDNPNADVNNSVQVNSEVLMAYYLLLKTVHFNADNNSDERLRLSLQCAE